MNNKSIRLQTLLLIFFYFTILIGGLFLRSDISWLLLLLIWLTLAFYSYDNLDKNGTLFAFSISFFVFLLGRGILENIFNYKIEFFSNDTELHSTMSLIISLLTILLTTLVLNQKNKFKIFSYKIKKRKVFFDTSYRKYIYFISKWLFILIIILSIIYKILVFKYVSSSGYYNYYSEYSTYLESNSLLYLLSKIEAMLPIVLSALLSTKPSKDKVIPFFLLYLCYLIISIGSGQRSTLILGILYMFIYMTIRFKEENKWFDKKKIIICLLLIPIMATFLSLISTVRTGESIENVNIFQSTIDFFYQQGVSLNIIKRAYMYHSFFPHGKIYFFEFLYSGILARIFGFPVFNGNTLDHALKGNSFTHTLGYIVLGNNYLKGQGTGTSYIAEIFYDFSYIGLIIFNILLATIIYKISNNESKSLLVQTLSLSIITQVLWMPRGSASGFISVLFFPSTIIILFVIFFGAYIFKKKNI